MVKLLDVAQLYSTIQESCLGGKKSFIHIRQPAHKIIQQTKTATERSVAVCL